MAIKGVSIPIVAKYEHDGNGKVTYSDPFIADAAVEYSVDVEVSEDNNLYADNKIKESAAGTFNKGTLGLTTSDISPELAVKMLGLKTVTRTINGEEVKEVVYDDSANPPYLGFGIIEEHQVNNITKYKPVVLAKVRFKNPGLAAATREEEVDWQKPEIEAAVHRSDQVDENYKNPWQFSPYELLETETEAKGYIMAVLGEK